MAACDGDELCSCKRPKYPSHNRSLLDFFCARERMGANKGKSHLTSTATIARPREDGHQFGNKPMDSDCMETQREAGSETGTEDNQGEEEDADMLVSEPILSTFH